MITRRQAVIGASCLAIAAALPLALTHAAPSQPSPRAPSPEAHRDLTLHIADGFRRQTWTYIGQTWDERRDTITLHEDEIVSLTLVNDTRDAVELPAAGPFAGLQLRGGQTASVLLHVAGLAPFDLAAVSHGEGITKACARQLRRFEVQASAGAHPLV